MKTQIQQVICLLILGLLSLQPKSLYSQDEYTPTWVFNISSRLKIESYNKNPFDGASIEDFRFYSGVLRSISPHTLIGLEVNSQLEPRYQFAHIGTTFRYYPLSTEKVLSPFAEVSPGAGWNRNRYYSQPVCSGGCISLISNRWFFYPLISGGFTWRPGLKRAALEVKAIYWPSYNAGPHFESSGEKISLRASFSYWIPTTKHK